MYPEHYVVNLWLKNKGYSVVSNLNAGKFVVDTIAFKEDILHVEVGCSVGYYYLEPEEVKKRFNDPSVKSTVKAFIKRQTGESKKYKQVFVTTSSSEIGVEVSDFVKILKEVIDSVDQQNYEEPLVRMLQLLRFVYLESPDSLSQAFDYLSLPAKKEYLEKIMQKPEVHTILNKKRYKKYLQQILKKTKPDELADTVHEVLGSRSKKKFLRKFIKHRKAQDIVSVPNQKPLTFFVKR